MKRNYQVKRNPRPKTKVRKRGRPPLDNRPMTSAERLRRLVTDLLLETLARETKVHETKLPGETKPPPENESAQKRPTTPRQ
jgi:hypothetical protein